MLIPLPPHTLPLHPQCHDSEWGDVPQSPGSDISLLCHDYFRLRHEGPQEGNGGSGSGGGSGVELPPLWRLSAVLERSRKPGRLARLHAAFPAFPASGGGSAAHPRGRLHLYFRPNPEHQQAIERFVCAPDVPGRDETGMLAIQTTQYYIPLLQANPRLGARMRRFFAPIDDFSSSAAAGAAAGAAGGTGGTPQAAAPFEPDLDAFGPLFRFLLRPSAAVEAAVEAFVAEHFAGASRVLGVHIRAGIPGADNTWVNAFGRGEGGLDSFERAARKCATQVATSLVAGGPRAAGGAAASSTAARSSSSGAGADAGASSGAGGGAGGVVVFVASDNAGMRGRTIDALRKVGGVRAVQYTPTQREPLASGQAPPQQRSNIRVAVALSWPAGPPRGSSGCMQSGRRLAALPTPPLPTPHHPAATLAAPVPSGPPRRASSARSRAAPPAG